MEKLARLKIESVHEENIRMTRAKTEKEVLPTAAHRRHKSSVGKSMPGLKSPMSKSGEKLLPMFASQDAPLTTRNINNSESRNLETDRNMEDSAFFLGTDGENKE